MPALDSKEYKERVQVAEAFFADVVAWMHFEAGQRVCNRSWGEMTVSLTWEDGNLRHVKVNGGHVIKPDGKSRLPGGSVDGRS